MFNNRNLKFLISIIFIVFLSFSIVGGCGGGGGDDDDGGGNGNGNGGNPPPINPVPPSSGTGNITGMVRSSSGATLNGVHVRAVNVDNTNIQIGTFSGLDSNFNVVNGFFSINNIPSGNYRVLIEKMDNRSGAFQPSRVSTFVIMSAIGQPAFPDEYYNGNQESDNDDPSDFTIVEVEDGQTTNNIDFITNNGVTIF